MADDDIFEDELTAARKRRAYDEGIAASRAAAADLAKHAADWYRRAELGELTSEECREIFADWRMLSEERPGLITSVTAAESSLATQLQVTVTAREAVAHTVVERDAARAQLRELEEAHRQYSITLDNALRDAENRIMAIGDVLHNGRALLEQVQRDMASVKRRLEMLGKLHQGDKADAALPRPLTKAMGEVDGSIARIGEALALLPVAVPAAHIDEASFLAAGRTLAELDAAMPSVLQSIDNLVNGDR